VAAQSTDAIRGLTAYSTGVHLFEFVWPAGQRGSDAVVGVATDEAPLHAEGYSALLGSDGHSWGWHLTRQVALHADAARPYPAIGPALLAVPDRLLMVLDMELGTLAFRLPGVGYLGPAHTGLRGRALRPAVSVVWGRAAVSMRRLASCPGGPPSLQAFSRSGSFYFFSFSLFSVS
jgi:hypothetical protein